jgi:iron complex outermembrane recepter protein
LVMSLGHSTLRQTVSLTADTLLNLVLVREVNALNEITVTAVTRATTVLRNPVPIAVLTRRDMARTVNSNLMDAVVKGTPGVSGVTTGPNITKPFIRGLGYNRVLTMYDGIRQEGQQWGDEHGIEVDQYGIERIEVVKGPASLIYGSDAIAGVINMLTEQPTGDGLRGAITNEYQSNNGMFGTSAAVTACKNGRFISARASWKTAHDYRNRTEGNVYNTGYQELNLSATGGVSKKWGSTRFGATYYNNLQEIPDGSRDSASRAFTRQIFEGDSDNITQRPIVSQTDLRSYAIAPLHQHIQHWRGYNHTELNTKVGDFVFDAALQQNIRREYNHPTAPRQPGLYLRLSTLNYGLKYNMRTKPWTTITFGVNGMYQQNKNAGATDFAVPDNHLFDIGGFVYARRQLGRLEVSGGLRYDVRQTGWTSLYTKTDANTGFGMRATGADTVGASLQFPEFSRRYGGLSGSIGATYCTRKGVYYKANIARGYRAPNVTEIGSNGLDPGAHIVYLGNRNFVPEFTLQKDIGVMITRGALTTGAELFHNSITNYIYQARAFDAQGNPIVVVPNNVTYQYQQSNATIAGGELYMRWAPYRLRWLRVSQTAAYTEGRHQNQRLAAKYGDLARHLPLIPPLQCRTDVQIDLPNKLRYVRDVTVDFGMSNFFAQNQVYRVDNTETPTAAYNLVSAGTSIAIKGKDGTTWCNLAIRVDNLFDVVYQSHLNRLKYFEYYRQSPNGRFGIYNPGRNVSIRIDVPIERRKTTAELEMIVPIDTQQQL